MIHRKFHLNVRELNPATLLAVLLGACIVWSYWPTLHEMERTWARNPRYSHGYFVPPFALYLLWMRRDARPRATSFGWLGLLVLLAAGFFRLFGAFIYLDWFDGLSFLLALAGLWTLVYGKEGLLWASPALAFLVFMVPLPYRLEVALGAPLQRISTEASTFGLQALGLPAFSSGETIVIGSFRLGIVDACNGLGISYMFLACAVAAAFMTWRPALDRVILIASAIPIALLVNVSRIIATGLLHETLGARVSAVVYHDLAGWLMLVMALAILYGECQLLKLVFVEVPETEPADTPPAETAAAQTDEPAPSASRPSLVAVALGIPLVIVSGLVYGQWTDRWQLSPALTEAVSRIERMPMTVGDWHGRTQAVDPRAIESAGLEGAVSRGFANSRTGATLSVMLVCGRPGPVSVHTPEICYPGAGYKPVQASPVKIAILDGPEKRGAEFLAADFENRQSLPADRLRIYWSWNADGQWQVPASPRLVFATRPSLYKLYLVSRTAADLELAMQDSTKDFLRQLLPELAKILFGKETTSADP